MEQRVLGLYHPRMQLNLLSEINLLKEIIHMTGILQTFLCRVLSILEIISWQFDGFHVLG